jgi:hypothetical protein
MMPPSFDPNCFDRGQESESDDDSIFVPFADLFSLLSLTVIYVVLTFGQTVPDSNSEPLVAATLQGSGAGKPIDPAAAYVMLRAVNDTVQFEVVKNGEAFDQAVPLTGAGTKIPEDWLKKTLSHGSQPSIIYVYLPDKETTIIVKALLTDTERFLHANFTNVRLAL